MRAEVDDGVAGVARAEVAEGVATGAAGQQVGAGAADDQVVAGAAGERVAAGTAGDRAAGRRAGDGEVDHAAVQVEAVGGAVLVGRDFDAVGRAAAAQAALRLRRLQEAHQRLLVGDVVDRLGKDHAVGGEGVVVAAVGEEVDRRQRDGALAVDDQAVVDQDRAVVEHDAAHALALADRGDDVAGGVGPRRAGAVVFDAQPRDLRVAALLDAVGGGAGEGVLEDVLELRGVDRARDGDEVGEGQRVEGIADGDRARAGDAGADAAAVLQRDVGAGKVAQAVGDQVAEVGLGAADALAVAARQRGAGAAAVGVEAHGGLADDLRVERRDMREHRLHDLRKQHRVAGDGVGVGRVQAGTGQATRDAQHARALDRAHRAGVVVEVDADLADVAIAEVRGDDRHAAAAGVGGEDRVRLEGDGSAGDRQVVGVAHQLVAAAGDDQVDPAQPGHQQVALVGHALQVAEDDDGLHALVVAQVVDLGLDQRQQGLQVLLLGVGRAPVAHDPGRRRRDARQQRRGDADHADLEARGGGEDLRGARDAAGGEVGELRCDREVEVDRQVGAAADLGKARGHRAGVVEVELVVAEDDRVEADAALGDRVVEVLPAVGVRGGEVSEAGVEPRAGQKGVAGVERQHGAAGGLRSRAALRDDGGQAVDAAVERQRLRGVVAQVALRRDQPRLLVADVQDRQRVGPGAGCAERERGGQRDARAAAGEAAARGKWMGGHTASFLGGGFGVWRGLVAVSAE